MREVISNNVHKFRVKLGITQDELGHKVGVTRQTIISLEKGNYTPSVSLALKLAKFFNVCVDDIFVLKKVKNIKTIG